MERVEKMRAVQKRSALHIFQTYLMASKPVLEAYGEQSNFASSDLKFTGVKEFDNRPGLWKCYFKITAGVLRYERDGEKFELKYDTDFQFSVPFAYEEHDTIPTNGMPLTSITRALSREFAQVKKISHPDDGY